MPHLRGSKILEAFGGGPVSIKSTPTSSGTKVSTKQQVSLTNQGQIQNKTLRQYLDTDDFNNSLSVFRTIDSSTSTNISDSTYIYNKSIVSDALGNPVLDPNTNKPLKRIPECVMQAFAYDDDVSGWSIKLKISLLYDYFNTFCRANVNNPTNNYDAIVSHSLINTANKMTQNDIENDTVVNHFTAYILSATLDLMLIACTYQLTGTDVTNCKSFIESALRPIVNNSILFDEQMPTITNKFMTPLYHTYNASSTVQTFITNAVGLAAFDLYNYMLSIDNMNQFGKTDAVPDTDCPCNSYYSAFVAKCAAYVNQYYYYQTILAILANIGMDNLKNETTYASIISTGTPDSKEGQIYKDVGVVMIRIENLFLVLEKYSGLQNDYFVHAIETHNKMGESQETLDKVSQDFTDQRQRLLVIMQKDQDFKSVLQKKRISMIIWAIVVLVYIGALVAFFNMNTPSVTNDKKAMMIMCIAGVVAIAVIVRELYITFTKKYS